MISKTSRLVGTDGDRKMSKSLDNCIYLSDDEKHSINQIIDKIEKELIKLGEENFQIKT